MQKTEISLDIYQNIPTDRNQYPVEFIERNQCLVLEKKDDRIIVGITRATDENIFSTIRGFHNTRVEFIYINQVELASWLGKKMGEVEPEKTSDSMSSLENTTYIDKMANDAPTVNLVNSICVDAIKMKASDIHIEAGIKNAKVRYRIDGVLQTIRTIENERFAAISSRIKVMANLNILEKRQPQDGRITVSINNENIDFRVSIVPITGGESIVMRILGRNTAPEQLDLLGFNKKQLDLIRKMMKISIEDPVEFIVEGVNQIQINEQINLGFDTILRRILRQDPNIIMVGEIRDKATAELSVRAALTGHLVLATLHTNDTISVIPRLYNMGIEPYLISSVLKGAIAQRLVRKLSPTTQKLEGRTVLSETLVVRNGMEFIKEDAEKKVQAGITTKAEAEKEILL